MADALQSIARARILRPTEGRYFVMDGDIRRSLDDRRGAVDAYRAGLALLRRDAGSWISASHKMILTIAETGDYPMASEEARRLVATVPADSLGYYPARRRVTGDEQPAGCPTGLASALAINPQDMDARSALRRMDEAIRIRK